MEYDPLIRSAVGQVREDLADLRGELREWAAKVDGQVATLAATRAGDHARLEDRLENVAHRGRSTEAAGQAMHDRLDVVEQQIRRAQWVAVGVALGAGTTSGGLVYALANALGTSGID